MAMPSDSSALFMTRSPVWGRNRRCEAAVEIRTAGRRPSPGRIGAATHRRTRARRRLPAPRSEEHTSELQSLMRISYAVFCLKKKNTITIMTYNVQQYKHQKSTNIIYTATYTTTNISSHKSTTETSTFISDK